MTAWFEDLPLDWAREDTRAAERLLITGYPTNFEAINLAQNAGLNLAQLNQMAPVKFLAREMMDNARLSNRLLRLVAEILADPSKEAQHEELSGLVAGHEDAVRDALLNSKPSLSKLAMLPPAIDIWSPADDAPRPSGKGGLERTINVMAGFIDPAKFRRGIAEAEVRTARIEVGGKARGTGFLIAPDLIMTNFHVIEAGVDGGLARFDHSSVDDGRTVAFAADWKVASSPHDSEANELGLDGPPDGTWDFAIVRLAEPAGEQAIGADPNATGADKRGFYALDWGPYEFEAAEPLLILGHPDGGPIQLSDASPAGARFTKLHNRVRYDTNTSAGSSGSPVFNKDFRVVALHHSASKGAGPGMFNQGVPIAAIGAALRTQLAGKPELTALGLT